ncbi:MAG: hypothetical protein GX595_07775 [Lentisphaerae bacterium]|nr:hypothetical protein [Lentisphaerota bacterium]
MNDNERKLQQEILSDAQRKAERLLARARSDAEKALAQQRQESGRSRSRRLAEAQREAETSARAITARIRHQVQSLWLQRRERCFDELFAAMLEDLENGQGIDRERSLRQLLQEALEALGPRPAVLRLGPAAAAVLTAAAVAEVQAALPAAAPLQRQVVDGLPGGLVVESSDGLRRFDNTYATRLKRLRGALRAQLSAGLPSTESDDEAHA